jgi:hypothetical protein
MKAFVDTLGSIIVGDRGGSSFLSTFGKAGVV